MRLSGGRTYALGESLQFDVPVGLTLDVVGTLVNIPDGHRRFGFRDVETGAELFLHEDFTEASRTLAVSAEAQVTTARLFNMLLASIGPTPPRFDLYPPPLPPNASTEERLKSSLLQIFYNQIVSPDELAWDLSVPQRATLRYRSRVALDDSKVILLGQTLPREFFVPKRFGCEFAPPPAPTGARLMCDRSPTTLTVEIRPDDSSGAFPAEVTIMLSEG